VEPGVEPREEPPVRAGLRTATATAIAIIIVIATATAAGVKLTLGFGDALGVPEDVKIIHTNSGWEALSIHNNHVIRKTKNSTFK
jgi:hypothetical protein